MSAEKVGESINSTATSSPCDFFHHVLNYTFHNDVMLVVMVTSTCFLSYIGIRIIRLRLICRHNFGNNKK